MDVLVLRQYSQQCLQSQEKHVQCDHGLIEISSAESRDQSQVIHCGCLVSSSCRG